MTLGQVKNVPNFCWFGQQRAEKRNFWRKKTLTLMPRFPPLIRAQFYKNVPSRKAPTGAIGTAHSLFYKIGLREGHQLWLVHSRAHQPELMPFPQSWCLSPKRLVYTCLAGRAPTIVGAFGKTHFYKIELSDANVSWGRAPTFRMFPPKFFSENVPSRRHQLAPSGKANFYKIGPRKTL